MKKWRSSHRYLINTLGFSALYLFTSSVGGYLLFAWLMGISFFLGAFASVVTGQPLTFYENSVFKTIIAGISYIVGIPVLVYLLNLASTKIKSVTFFAGVTFFLTLFAEYYAHSRFFIQDHHLNNPIFYLVVLLYIGTKTLLLTYIWKLLIRDNVASDLPIKTYLVAAFALAVLFIPVYLATVEGSYIPLGRYLFDNHLVNIFFLDQSGYLLVTLSLYVVMFVAIVAKVLRLVGKRSK